MTRVIVQVNSVCNGSTGKIAGTLQEIMEGEGIRAITAYGRGADNGRECIRIGSDFEVLRHVALSRILGKHGHGSKKGTRIFIDKLRALKPDIIHLHNIHGYYINIEMLFSYIKSENIPVVWTLHDCWSFTGHCAYFDYANCSKWKGNCCACTQKYAYPKSLLLNNSSSEHEYKKRLFSGIENMTIVTPSQWLANLVRESFLKEYPIRVINNGINLEVFRGTDSRSLRKKLAIKDDRAVILGVSASFEDKRKGFKFFRELADKIDEKIIILLIGVSKGQIKTLPSNIIGMERTENVKELVEAYSMADVFVNPTLEDNYPTVNLEAIACGTPVVAFDTGGCREQISPGSGIVVPTGDTQALFDNVMKLLEKRQREGLKSPIDIPGFFDYKLNFNEYIDLYNKVAKG